MANGIGIINGFDVSNKSAIDKRWGPYEGTSIADCISQALTAIPVNYRYEGLTVLFKVNTDDIVEYWFEGGTADGDLVIKLKSYLSSNGGLVVGDVSVYGTLSATTLAVESTTVVTNLNADMLDGQHGNFYVNSGRTITAGKGLTGGGLLATDITISHANTSDIANIATTNTNGTVIRNISVTFDEFGHVTALTPTAYDLDGRYYTETEADGRFVNVSGDTMTGDLTIQGALNVIGDIYQSGTTYQTHVEELYTQKDIIYLREGAIAGLADGAFTGIEAVKYDGTNNGRLVFDNTGTARVGDAGSEQPLTTRDESVSMTDQGFTYWDATTNKIKTSDITTTNIDDRFINSDGDTINGNFIIGEGYTISGDGSGLTNIQADAVVGLQLDRITSTSGLTTAIATDDQGLLVSNAAIFTGDLSALNLSGTNTGDERYTNATPMPTAVGGAPAGTTFNNMTIQAVLNYILYPELNPTLTAPSSTFTVGLNTYYEVGSSIATLTFNSTFNRGLIHPDYTTAYPYSDAYRSGLPTQYNYTGTGLSGVTSTSLTDVETVSNYVVLAGVQSWTGSVSYGAGPQPYTSKLNTYGTALSAGTTAVVTRSTTGLYPFLYGMSASVLDGSTLYPAFASTRLIQASGNKTLTLNGNLQYIYFGYPASYGSLVSIIDQNGFNVTGSFQSSTYNVTSTGLTSNFTTSYKVYRTTDVTTVLNGSYQFKFS